MSYRKVCDLCGKEMTSFDKQRHFKIKEYFRRFPEWGWIKIDAHDECVRELVDAVKTNPPTPSVGSVQNDLLRNCIDEVIEQNRGKEVQAETSANTYENCADVRSVNKENNNE